MITSPAVAKNHGDLVNMQQSSLIPQPGGWGSFIPAYKISARRCSPNPPTGRLGIVHSRLQERRADPRRFQIPQPGGWGSFIPAYKAAVSEALSRPPTCRLGVIENVVGRRVLL